MTTVDITTADFEKTVTDNDIVLVDFWAEWCGPCKMIAPAFESLSTKYSKPGKITFCKVNVDNQQPIAQAHGVRAMPTFLIFKNGSVIDTIQGANPPALTAAVEKAVKLAGTAAACWFNGTTLAANLYTRRPAAAPANATAAGGGWNPWQFAFEVNQTIAGGPAVPNCYAQQPGGSLGSSVTQGLVPQPASDLCGCYWRNFDL